MRIVRTDRARDAARSAWGRLHRRVLAPCVVLSLALCAGAGFAQTPLGTDFTYQGSLELSGSPVDGTADFQFKLMTALTGGSQIGSTQAVSNANVVDGGFTVTLDFGAGAFNGAKRFLEIAVRSPAGGGSFTTLAPRQPLTASPYALEVPGVDGHSLDASDGSPVNALLVGPTGDVGIGTTSPAMSLHVQSAEPVMLLQDTDAAANQSGYLGFWNNASVETGWVGFGTPGSAQYSIVNARSGGDIALYPGAGGVVSVPVLEVTGADLAEKFPTSGRVEPGMVVAIDPQSSGKLCLARGAYNGCVAGVVSGANDFSAGAIVGKSMTSLAEGRGLVLDLVNLQ